MQMTLKRRNGPDHKIRLYMPYAKMAILDTTVQYSILFMSIAPSQLFGHFWSVYLLLVFLQFVLGLTTT